MNIIPAQFSAANKLRVLTQKKDHSLPQSLSALDDKAQQGDDYDALFAFITICDSEVALLNSSAELIVANKAWSNRARMAGQLITDNGHISFAYLSSEMTTVQRIHSAVWSVTFGEEVDRRIQYRVGRGAAQRHFEVHVASFTFGTERMIAVFNRDVSEIRALMAEKRVLTDQLLKSEEKVQRRIAREMHDSTVQDLVAIGLNLSRLGHLDGDPVAREVTAEIRDILRRTQRDVRTLSYLLHPPLLDEGGISLALGALVRGLANRMETRVRYEAELPDRRIPTDIEIALYRVAQEALLNIHRHAKAADAWVRLSSEPGQVILEIEDNGTGISGLKSRMFNSGVGISGMRARIEQVHGTFVISRLDRGTSVFVAVPVKMPA